MDCETSAGTTAVSNEDDLLGGLDISSSKEVDVPYTS